MKTIGFISLERKLADVNEEERTVFFNQEKIKSIEIPESLEILINQIRPFIRPEKGFGMDEIVTLIAKVAITYKKQQ